MLGRTRLILGTVVVVGLLAIGGGVYALSASSPESGTKSEKNAPEQKKPTTTSQVTVTTNAPSTTVPLPVTGDTGSSVTTSTTKVGTVTGDGVAQERARLAAIEAERARIAAEQAAANRQAQLRSCRLDAEYLLDLELQSLSDETAELLAEQSDLRRRGMGNSGAYQGTVLRLAEINVEADAAYRSYDSAMGSCTASFG